MKSIGFGSFRAAVGLSLCLLGGCETDPGYGERSSKEWVQQLQRGTEQQRIEAAGALAKILEIRPNFPAVVAALSFAVGDTSDAVRLTAANALATPGVDPSIALPGLRATLQDSAHPSVRASTAYIIGGLGAGRGIELVPPLVEAVNDSVAVVRGAAIEALGLLKATSESVVAAIIRHSADFDPSVRRAVLQTLMNLRADPSRTVPVARSRLRDSVVSVRMAAAYTLGSLGSKASPALPDLRNALRDSSAIVRTGAAFAIGEIGPPARAAIPDLKALLSDSSSRVVDQARAALTSIGGKKLSRGYAEPSRIEKCASNPNAPGC